MREKDRRREILRYVYAVVKRAGEEEGLFTTAVHKLVYFALLEGGGDVKEFYVPYFYGPFSFWVAYALDTLTFSGYITREEQELGKKFKVLETEKEVPQERAVEELLKKLSTVGVGVNQIEDLSILAKVHWLITQGGVPKDPDELVSAAQELNWKIKKDDAEKALKRLERMGYA